MPIMTWLLIVLAAAPFATKAVSIAWLGQNYIAQSAYKVLQFVAPVGWRRAVDRRRWRECLWPVDEPWPSAGVWTAAVAVAIVAVGIAAATLPSLATYLGIDAAALREDMDARFSITPWRAVAVVVFLTTFNSALEELHFRAWLDPELSKRFGNAAGIFGSAAAFAAMHLFIFANMRGATFLAMALVFLALAVMATAWSLLARQPGGIHAAWLSHALTDAGLLTWGLVWLGYF
jgi:membrane protease YdiL (CAAX protease family)